MARQNRRDTEFTEYVQARTAWLRRIACLLMNPADWTTSVIVPAEQG